MIGIIGAYVIIVMCIMIEGLLIDRFVVSIDGVGGWLVWMFCMLCTIIIGALVMWG